MQSKVSFVGLNLSFFVLAACGANKNGQNCTNPLIDAHNKAYDVRTVESFQELLEKYPEFDCKAVGVVSGNQITLSSEDVKEDLDRALLLRSLQR